MAHALGGYYDLPHGECNAILLPHVIAYNYPYASTQYNRACAVFAPEEEPGCDLLLYSIRELMSEIGIIRTLRDFEVKESDFQALAEISLQDACMATNPSAPTVSEIVGIFENAF